MQNIACIYIPYIPQGCSKWAEAIHLALFFVRGQAVPESHRLRLEECLEELRQSKNSPDYAAIALARIERAAAEMGQDLKASGAHMPKTPP